MNNQIHILHLEYNDADAKLIQAILDTFNVHIQITHVHSRVEFENTLRNYCYDLILSDYNLPGYNGISALQLTKELYPDIPFIFVSGVRGEDAAINGLIEGATDYVLKHKLSRLLPALNRALPGAENQYFRQQTRPVITNERKLYEAELLQHKKLQEQFSSIAAAIPGFIFTIREDTNGRSYFPFLSTGVEELFGLHYEDIRHDATLLHARYHPDDLPCIIKLLEETKQSLDQFCMEVRINHSTKGQRWIEIRSTPIRQPDGATEWHGFMYDITDRKCMEQALALREQEMSSLAESSPDAIMRYDREGHILYLNAQLETHLGVKLADIKNKHTKEIWTDGRYDKILEAVNSAIDKGIESTIELAHPLANREYIYSQVCVVPERDKSGEIIGALAFGRDITEQKKVEITLNQVNRKLRAISNCNQALLKMEDEQALLNEVCRIICDEADYLLAWVGYVKNHEGKAIHPVAWAGKDSDYIKNIKLSCSDLSEIELEPECTVIQTGETLYYQNLLDFTHLTTWQKSVIQQGFHSIVALPLKDKENITFGVLTIYSGIANNITHEEIDLLNELANNLAYGITTLRLRIAFQQSVEKLRKTEKDLQTLVDDLPDGIARFDANDYCLFANRAFPLLLEIPTENMIGKSLNEISITDDSSRIKIHQDLIKKTFQTGISNTVEGKWKTSNGIHYFNTSHIPEKNEKGEVVSILCIVHNITESKKAEEERKKHLYFFESMDKINHVIQQSNDLQKSMYDILHQILSIFDCDRAFLVHPCDPDAETWSVPMEVTKPEYPGMHDLGLTFPMNEYVTSIFKILLNADAPVKFGSGDEYKIAKEELETMGVKSYMSMAIYPKIGKPWQFGIHQCAYTREWKPEEEKLLQEIGRRLEDALTSLLTYQNLKESEERFRLTLETTQIGLWDWNIKDDIWFASPVYYTMLGYEPTDGVDDRQQWLDRVHPDDLKEATDKIENILTQNLDSYEHEVRIRHAHGNYRWQKVIGFGIEQDTNGKTTRMLGVSMDIHDRIQNAQQIEMLGFALNNSSDAVFIRKENSLHFIYVNDSACHSLEYSREELMQLTAFDFNLDFSMDMVNHLMDNLSKGQSIIIESKHKTKDGKIFPVEIIYTLFRYGNQKYLTAIVRNISERKQAEESLRQSEERYRRVFEHSPVSIWEENFTAIFAIFDELKARGVTDLNDFLTKNTNYIKKCADSIQIHDINQAALQLHKAKNKEELLRRLTNTFTTESYLIFKQELINLWNGKTSLTYDAIVQTLKGEKRDVTVYFSLLPIKDGQTRAIVSLVDITERKKFEEEIIKSEYSKTILNRIANIILTTPDDKMYEKVLIIIQDILKSRYGKFGYIDENSNLVLPSLTKDIWPNFQGTDKSILFPKTIWETNIWGKAIIQQQSYISKGPFHTPKGHSSIANYIVVPIIYGRKTIGIISIADKESDYTDDDKEILEEIAKFISPILEGRLQQNKLETMRKIAENELRKSEERFSAAFKMNPLAMSILRFIDTRFVDVNDAFIHSSGYTREEIIGHTPNELSIYANKNEHDNMIQILKKTGYLNNYEFNSITKSGDEGIKLHSASIINFGGEEHYLSIFQDITEKKQLEQKIIYTTIETEEKERQRFAQELHDGIGPLLSSVKMLIEWILKPHTKAKFQQTLEKVLGIVDEAHQTIREVSFNLSPHVLQNFGLIEALNAYAEKIRESSTIKIEIVSNNFQNRDIHTETILYRVLTECISNTLRHANATKIDIIFNEDDKYLQIFYSDNGKGFILEGKKHLGLGMLNMQNRMNSLNGKIKIDSDEGKGIKIYIEIKKHLRCLT